MLVSFFDALTGVFSKRLLMGRRLVLDFTSAKEQRVSVLKLPEGSFSFDLRARDDGMFALEMRSSDSSVVTLATYDDLDLAEKTMKKLKMGILKPFTKIVLAFLGLLIIILASDLASVPRSSRVPRAAASAPAAAPSSLPPEQLNAIRERLANSATQQGPGAAAIAVPKEAGSPTESSPEAQAAINLLKGK